MCQALLNAFTNAVQLNSHVPGHIYYYYYHITDEEGNSQINPIIYPMLPNSKWDKQEFEPNLGVSCPCHLPECFKQESK